MSATGTGGPPQLQHLVDESADVLVQVEGDGTLGYVSRGSHRLFGYQPEELHGTKLISLIHPGEHTLFEADWRRLQLGACQVTGAYRIRHKAGRLSWAEIAFRGLPEPSGSCGAVGVVRDMSERLSAEHKVRQSDEPLRLLVDGVLEYAMYVLDLDGIITTWNHGAELMKGYRAQEIIGRHFSIFYTREDVLAGVPARALECAKLEGTFQAEAWLVRKDGSRLWASVVISPMYDSVGGLVGFAKVTRDVTARKQADEQRTAIAADLREANRRMLVAEDMAHVGHWRLALPSNELSWSDEIYRTYGIPKGTAVDLEVAMCACKLQDQARLQECFRETAHGIPFVFESQILRPDGSVRDIYMNGQLERAPDGTPMGILGLFQDLTDLKVKDRERERLIERVTLATIAAGVGVWDWDIQANSLLWDASMCALYGLPATTAALPLEVWSHAVHPDDYSNTRARLEDAVAGGTPFDHEFRIIRQTGDTRYIHARAVAVRDADGSAVRMVGTNLDVTQIRLLAAELRAEKERLLETVEQLSVATSTAEEASRAKSNFLARMSHEIRTPMNGILGFATILLDSRLTPAQRKQVGYLDAAGKSLLAIINDVLDFSKIEAQAVEIEHVALSPTALVDGALSIIRIAARSKGIILTVDVDPSVPEWVSGDPTRLRQILLNLLTNAIKFTDAGTISVIVRSEDPASEARLRFEISDTGIGIAAESEQHLFANFSQLEHADGRHYGGTGLGLAISKRLAEAMDGDMSMSHNAAGGSTFWFTALLPAVAAPAAEQANTAGLKIVSRRILVAEDNAINQIVVETLLNYDGHEVVLVGNGQEAVDAAKSGYFDLILMDMEMPVMKGAEATRRIRSSGVGAWEVPIIALTANAMATQIQECRDAGMNDHLAKPIDRELLRAAVAKWTGDAQARTGANASVATAPLEVCDIGVSVLLELFDGDVTSVANLLSTARISIENDLERIESAAVREDASGVVDAAHRLKGTSGSISAQRLSEVASFIERVARQERLAALAPLLVELRAAVRVTAAAIVSFSEGDGRGEMQSADAEKARAAAAAPGPAPS